MSLFDDIDSFLNHYKIKDLPNNTRVSIGDDYDLGDLRADFDFLADEIGNDYLTFTEDNNSMTTELPDFNSIQIQLRQILFNNAKLERTDEEYIDIANDMLIDLDNSIDDMSNKLTLSEVEDNSNLKSIVSQLEIVNIELPHMRKRRKQWGGKPTFRQNVSDFNVNRAKGYSMRSMLYKFPKFEVIPYKQLKSRMKRSISHVQLWSKVNITGFETVKSRFDLDLYDAHKQFCYTLFEQEQENTSARKDAWDTYLPSGMLEQFIESSYIPSLRGFSELPSKMKAFISSAWDTYSETARNERQERYGMNLTSEEVNKLQNSDKSIFTTKFGE